VFGKKSVEMESHHDSSKKHFLKLRLSHGALESFVEKVLGRTAFYPLHLTLTTIHLVSDRPDIFHSLSKSIVSWKPPLPEELEISNLHLEVMGVTHIKFLSLCFSCENLNLALLVEHLCGHLSRELDLERRRIEVNGRIECELLDSGGIPVIHIPLGEKSTHVSILSTNDMKKNKSLYKSYSNDPSSLLELIDISVITGSLFRIESISFT
jgi:hypothetical protein